MHFLHRSSVAGGARALRRVDSSPRPPLSKNDSIKKRGKESSRRRRLGAKLSAVLRKLKLVPRAREKSYRPVHLTGGGGGTATRAVASTDDADQRAWLGPGASRLGRGTSADVAGGRFGRPDGGVIGRGRRCASSWALAAALVLVLACVVALGKAPAICCCTCAAWWRGGGRMEEHRSGSACRRPIGSRHSSVQPQTGGSSSTVLCTGWHCA